MVYSRGGQLVFRWDRLENFLLTRDRPVDVKITSTKCQSCVSHVQIQCAIALVSDAQKVKCLLLHLNRYCYAIIEKHYNTSAASAVLAYGQPSQETRKNIGYVTNQLMDNFYAACFVEY